MLPKTHHITADRAFAHIVLREPAVRHVLALAQYAGAYVLQAGFNEEMAHAGQRVEELYVALEAEVSEEVPRALTAVFAPFQSVVWTTYFVPGETEEEVQEVLEDGVVGVQVANKQAALGGEGEGRRVAAGKGKEVDKQGGGDGAGGGDDAGGNGEDDEQGGSGGNDGGDEGGSGGGGGGGSGGGGKDEGARGPRFMSIPLTSTLSSKEDSGAHITTFTAGYCLDITVREHGSHSRK